MTNPNKPAPAAVGEIEEHGDWLIWYAPPPIKSRRADWHFAHKDFTSEHDGDPRSGTEESRAMCLQTIDYLEDMEREDKKEEAQLAAQGFADRAMRMYAEKVLLHELASALKNVCDLPSRGNQGFAAGIHKTAALTALKRYGELFGSKEQAHD